MIALFKKEISMFFGTLIGYIIISIFLLFNGIILWTNVSQFNILDYGYANMDMFFDTSPMLFILFIPALSMRVFTEEYNSGTIEILITKPLSILNIIFAKFLAIICLIIMSLLPTISYVVTIYFLGDTIGNLDLASILGSYLGLLLLSVMFTSISIYASALSKNQVTSFIISTIICCLFFFGFDLLSKLLFTNSLSLFIQKIGINYHYNEMSKGLIKLSDIIYFLSITFLFLKLTEVSIRKKHE